MKGSLQTLIAFFLSSCCLLLVVHGMSKNQCTTYSCGCCCSQDSKACCNPGYKNNNGNAVANAKTGIPLAYNDGFVLDPEEEAVETLGKVTISSIMRKALRLPANRGANYQDDDEDDDDDGGNSRVPGGSCKISCERTYTKYKGAIHTILGLKKSLSCTLPPWKARSFFYHDWKTKLVDEKGKLTGETKCFTMFDLGGVNRSDRVKYLRQIVATCFQKEEFSCEDVTDDDAEDTSPVYSTYFNVAKFFRF